jgi:hypothetical protein
MAEQADRTLRPTTFQPGELVLVSQAKIRSPEERAKFSGNLSARYIGPYEIIENLGSGNYRIKLPANIRAHDVINVEHFKKFSKPDNFEPEALWTDEDGTYFYPEKLVKHRYVKRKRKVGKRNRNVNTLEFLVRWRGYSPDHDTWEPEANVKEFAQPIIDMYWQSTRRRDGQ